MGVTCRSNSELGLEVVGGAFEGNSEHEADEGGKANVAASQHTEVDDDAVVACVSVEIKHAEVGTGEPGITHRELFLKALVSGVAVLSGAPLVVNEGVVVLAMPDKTAGEQKFEDKVEIGFVKVDYAETV